MRLAFLLIFFISNSLSTAQDLPDFETITRQADDDITLVADFYAADSDAPLIILLHMLNSNRAAYEPIIPDLHAGGYALLNVDMRGHGDSGGAQDWDLAMQDVADWTDWLDAQGGIGEGGLVIMGASIGSNLALISCAASELCRSAIALSPGLDFRGVQPESALVDGLTERAALLVAAHQDGYSADTVRQLFSKAKGAVTARLGAGRAHGTRLFDSDYDSVSALILHWLSEQFSDQEM